MKDDYLNKLMYDTDKNYIQRLITTVSFNNPFINGHNNSICKSIPINCTSINIVFTQQQNP
jgi:hypothetical protein